MPPGEKRATALAAGLSGMAVLLLGLVWRLLTDGLITRGDSRAFPQESRVLLYAGNSLVAVLALAMVSLTRTDLPQVDIETFAGMGTDLIGSPVLLGALLVALVPTRVLVPGVRVPPAVAVVAEGPGADKVQTPVAPVPENVSRDEPTD